MIVVLSYDDFFDALDEWDERYGALTVGHVNYFQALWRHGFNWGLT